MCLTHIKVIILGIHLQLHTYIKLLTREAYITLNIVHKRLINNE